MITTKIKETNAVGSRIVSIRSKKLSILGMERALTSTELNYTTALKEAGLPPLAFPNKVFEMRREFTAKMLSDMLKRKGEFLKIVRQVRPLAMHNPQRINIFRSIVKSVKPLDWPEVRAAFEVGIFGGYDVITVPDFHFTDMQSFGSYIAKSRDHIYDAATRLKGDFECMPTLTIANNRWDELKDKINILKDLGITAINIENADFYDHYSHYNTIRDFAKENDVLLYGSEVKRIWSKNKASLMHIYPFFGIDIVALARPPKSFLAEEGQRSVHDVPKSRAKLYDPSTDGVLSRGEYSLLYNDQLKADNFPLLTNQTVTSAFNRFDNQLLMKVTKLHETVECWHELRREGDAIINGDYEMLMKKKKCIAPVLAMVKQRTLY